jgi:hypothetical protein
MPPVVPHITTIEKVEELQQHTAAIEALAENAIEPNVFYEPWYLQSALKHFAAPEVAIVLIWNNQLQSTEALIGLFPIENHRSYHRLPLSYSKLWRHQQTFLTTPLVHKKFADQSINTFLEWYDKAVPAQWFMQFSGIAGDGEFYRELVRTLSRNGRSWSEGGCHERAFVQSQLTAADYSDKLIARKVKKELRRKRKQLEDLGRVARLTFQDRPDAVFWRDELYRLEMSGWKGRNGTAIGCRENTKAFFSDVITEAANRDKLSAMALTVDDKVVAVKLNMQSGRGLFALKIAYDEEFARFSPGSILEYEFLQHFLNDHGAEWMDSCADPSTRMLNELLRQRRIIRCVNVATRDWRSTAWVTAMSAAHSLYRMFFSKTGDKA